MCASLSGWLTQASTFVDCGTLYIYIYVSSVHLQTAVCNCAMIDFYMGEFYFWHIYDVKLTHIYTSKKIRHYKNLYIYKSVLKSFQVDKRKSSKINSNIGLNSEKRGSSQKTFQYSSCKCSHAWCIWQQYVCEFYDDSA